MMEVCRMTETQKICPLMSSDDSKKNWVYCEREKCAFWCDGNCAAVIMARNLGNLEFNVFHGLNKVTPGL